MTKLSIIAKPNINLPYFVPLGNIRYEGSIAHYAIYSLTCHVKILPYVKYLLNTCGEVWRYSVVEE